MEEQGLPVKSKGRYGLFKIGLGLLLFSFIGMCSHYKIEKAIWGVPNEYYPEYLWLFVAMPISGLVTFIGLIIAARKSPSIEGKK